MAAAYPKIYSLCTVGVRQHYNSEYLFHQVRTDLQVETDLENPSSAI